MASNDERVPFLSESCSLSDNGDSKRLHPTMNNSISSDGRSARPRGSSNTSLDSHQFDSSRYHQARQPINDAVTSAFNNADATSAASIPPELLQQITSQITANVLQQLKGVNLPTPAQPPPLSGSQVDAASSTTGSPPLNRATVYTPPTPHRTSEDAGMGHPSPQFPPAPQSKEPSFRGSPPPVENRAVSPFSQASHQSEDDTHQDRPVRPKGPKRVDTGGDATTLERVWGTLFDEQGQATVRLGQFLRGIAVHLIEDYEPRHSLVITPAKMQKYYEETKLSAEVYPWKIVFDDRTSSISRMFRDIEAEHHLVQEKLHERPDLPGLTPRGFETWATLLLKAHPDQEFERLAKTALDMPISNPDDKKERFPKEISRRLFPTRSDTEIAYKLQKAMSTHCNVNFASRQGSTASAAESGPRASQPNQASEETHKTTMRPAPDKQDPINSTSQPSPSLSQTSQDRQRQPYSSAPSDAEENTVENTEDTPTPQPIERERKPYVAAPGGGKTYDVLDKPAEATEMKAAPAPPPHESRLGRSNSVHATSGYNDNSRSGAPAVAVHQKPPPPPMDAEAPRHHRSNSTYHREQPKNGRNRSPSMSKENGSAFYGRKPETEVPYASSRHSYNGNDPYEEARRYKEYELQRERLANDRYDAARMAAYDPRERERERARDNRPRMQSVSGHDGRAPPPYSSSVPDEEYYRDPRRGGSATSYGTPAAISTGFQPPPPPPGVRDSASIPRDTTYGSYPSSAGYPPTSYRDMR
ncbi:hypothetical protein PV05_03053 [Exophiala xenobiotica]|uniref:DUF7514 domain-containing protein n=1 Tax=Exophiala xenobiotica TaxID=348802 RepID=A0A0D2FEN7_9EURO|nr:uncharacterized protein PV05_03053 [Exophiala xenobiotica]KIW58544.1 hypothetical protein PV05_03053 [Exophiala xenobiotica]